MNPDPQLTQESIRAVDAVARPAPQPSDLDAPELYINRELSWVDFDDRVLQLAEDADQPLLERCKFAAIFGSNLDEFFMIRVAGLHDQVDAGITAPKLDGRTPSETIDAIREKVLALSERQHRTLSHDLRPSLAEHGIRLVGIDDVSSEARRALDHRFRRQIFPVLTPLAVGLGRPFPYISNLSLSLAVLVRDPVSGQVTFARVKVPKEMLPRFVALEDEPTTFVPMEELIAANLEALFPGMEVIEHGVFRVTRDADFEISDEADDLLTAVEDELRRRRFGEVVRVEIGTGMAPALCEALTDALEVSSRQVYEVHDLLDLTDLWQIVGLKGFDDLRDPPWQSVTQPRLRPEEHHAKVDMFAAMRAGDILVHHPYDSFSTSVGRFVEQAANDPDVLAIKLTIYRTSDDTPLIPALIRATERGKQAVCLVELKARFDERANIEWARKLEETGVHVVYGHPALKTHAKCILVVRREGDGVRHYLHIGTGNYHPKTARLYTDFGLFTTDERLGSDVADMFNFLTGYARPRRYRKAAGGARPPARRHRARDRADDRGPQRRTARAHPDEVELPGRPDLHQGAVPRFAGGRAGGAQHPRDLLPGAGGRGRQREHPRGVDRGPLPRAFAGLHLPARRRAPGLHRLGRPDAAQPRHARRARHAGTGPDPARRPA